MRRTSLILVTCAIGAACSFEGNDADSGPPPGEEDLSLDSVTDFSAGAEQADTFVSSFGTVEPAAWLPGKLLAEIDNGNGPFGSWAMRPARGELVNVGLMAPPFLPGQTPPGATGANYILWFSGEIRLDKGNQKLALGIADNATAFAEILKPDGSVLVACTQVAECTFSTTAAGWYPLRIGWRRPNNATDHTFELRWAADLGIPTDVPADRLRVRAHVPELAGWRLEGYEAPRSINHVANAVALNYKEPFAMTWSPALLGLSGGSPGYRNAGQLRIPEEGSYDFTVTAASEAAYRLWIDGEWVTDATRWDPQPSGVKQEMKTRQLSAGWHDVVLEGYEDGGNGNMLELKMAKSGQAVAAPPAAQVRPLLSATTAVTGGANLATVLLVKAAVVPQTLTVAPVTTAGPPEISAVDVWLRLRPMVWDGLIVTLRPPGVASPAIALNVDLAGRVDDEPGDIHASLSKAQLGNAAVAGNWIVEITHPNAGGGLDADNALTRARINVHYKGGPATGSPAKVIAQESRYARMVSLDAEHELRDLIISATQPAGTSIAAHAQICQDAGGADCGEALTPQQLAAMSPVARHVKLVVSFQSDGFAIPMLDKLTLRYRK